jgi:hypothetical protein
MDFLEDVANFVCDDATRLEQQTYHTFRIQESTGSFRHEPVLPAADAAGHPLRRRPAAET